MIKNCLGTAMSDVVHIPPKSYYQVPGPRPLPLLGNSWRFLPYIGK